MCGRVYQNLGVRQLQRLAGTNRVRNQQNHQTSYNVCPSTYIPAIKHANAPEDNNRELDMIKWGYYAPFGQYIVNARVEEASEKRTYKNLINSTRAVMIVEGYFEWTPDKKPFVFRPKETNDPEKPACLYIAGIVAPDDTFILFTRESFEGFTDVHHRMPVILNEEEIDLWLDCGKYKFENILFSEILNEKKEKWSNIYHYRISPLINSNKANSSKVLMKLEDYQKEQDKNGIMKFFQPTKKDKEKDKESVTNKDGNSASQSTQATTQATQSTTQVTQPTYWNPLFEERKVAIDDSLVRLDIQMENFIETRLTDEQRAAVRDRTREEEKKLEDIRKSLGKTVIGATPGLGVEKESRKRRVPADGTMLISDLFKQSKKTTF